MLVGSDTGIPRPIRVLNKNPARIQITAEHILREAREGTAPHQGPPKQKIANYSELANYLRDKRKQFEDRIRRSSSGSTPTTWWIRYAKWEESQHNLARARSLWERALGQASNYRHHTLWLNYAEFEMRNKCINHARNVLDRALALLPAVDHLWYKYIHMEEEMLGCPYRARQVFVRWMGLEPDVQAWLSYVRFELRHCEVGQARSVFEGLVSCHPMLVSAWISYARFEVKNREVSRARAVYERAITLLSDDDEALFLAFAEFEEKCKETERARCIYKYALNHIPKERTNELFSKYVALEKRHGTAEGIEDAILRKRKLHYAEEVARNQFDYDSWFDYIRSEESIGDSNAIKETYERAIASVLPAEEKRYWKPYIYIWINYALYEELVAKDGQRTREVYRACLDVIPHDKFSFSKIWILAAQFELRQKNLVGARRIFDIALRTAPKEKIFRKYIETELQLGQISHCRALYEKYIHSAPAKCHPWSEFADFERSLGETERARAIFELTIAQPELDHTQETLWMQYIKFEISEGEFERARRLYERFLHRTKHLRVWLSYAKFEAQPKKDGNASLHEHIIMQRVQSCRCVFQRAYDYFRNSAPELKEERAILLEEWIDAELSFGRHGDVATVMEKSPRKMKRKRAISSEDGNPIGSEEYMDYIFPDEASPDPCFKILEAAYNWKRQKTDSEDCLATLATLKELNSCGI